MTKENKEKKEKMIALFENIKKNFDDTAARDKLVIDYINYGIRVLVFHNITRLKNPTLCEFTSELTVQRLDDGYCFMIVILGKQKKKTVYIKKTPDFDVMMHVIKGFYNWD